MPQPRLINLGCGRRFHRDWLNFDLVSSDPAVTACDLTRGIPVQNDSCDAVYHSNMLEHLRPGEARQFLSECRRALRPGGILRIAIPDLEQICREYLQQLDAAAAGDALAAANREWMILELIDQMVRDKPGGEMMAYLCGPLPNREFVLNRIGLEGRDILASAAAPASAPPPGNARRLRSRLRFRLLDLLLKPAEKRALELGRFRMAGEVHQWMYDRFSLAALLREVGFSEVARVDPHTSRIPGWPGFHLEVTAAGEVIKPDSFQMEAIK